MPLHFDIKTIPHRAQRYDTLGDYWADASGISNVRVTELGDWRYEFLVAIHELIELALTRQRGISEPSIMAFDMAFTGKGEPGDNDSAPYRCEHRFAENIERLVCAELGIHWRDYERALEDFYAAQERQKPEDDKL